MKLRTLAAQYVAHKRTLGMKFETPARDLKAFCRAMGPINMSDVQVDRVMRFLLPKDIRTPFYDRKYSVLTGFYEFAVARGFVARFPLPPRTPRQPQILVPYIYSRKEISVLLALARRPYPRQSRVEPHVIHALLLLLYAAGLRISEALALTLADVDVLNDQLIVRDTKFYKSRCIPVCADLKPALLEYLRRRARDHGDDPSSPCFPFKSGRPLTRACAEQRFRRLCARAGIHRPGGPRVQPRLHDLRHSAAVHRVLAWYRRGKDIQRLLPRLATFLGHVNLTSTQRYLTLTPELMDEASHRFERHVQESYHG